MTFKIIFDDRKLLATEHAKETLKRQRDYYMKDAHPLEIRPMNVQHHMAQHPKKCEECAETFWSADPWALHIGCRGRRTGAGF